MAQDVTATCNGIRYCLDLRDNLQRELYFNLYEKVDLRLALELTPVGGTCIDIGANNGVYALHFARKVGKTGVVHAYEPDPVIYSRLVSNGKLNSFQEVLHCHRFGVSDLCGSRSFYRSDPRHSGWGSLVEFEDIAVKTEPIETITLDAILENEGLTRVDVLKIDVEAHEPEVLEGARKSLHEHAFRFVLIEFNGIRLAERGKTLDDFLKPFTSSGYAPVKLRIDLLNKMLDGNIAPDTVLTNFLFAPRQ